MHTVSSTMPRRLIATVVEIMSISLHRHEGLWKSRSRWLLSSALPIIIILILTPMHHPLDHASIDSPLTTNMHKIVVGPTSIGKLSGPRVEIIATMCHRIMRLEKPLLANIITMPDTTSLENIKSTTPTEWPGSSSNAHHLRDKKQ